MKQTREWTQWTAHSDVSALKDNSAQFKARVNAIERALLKKTKHAEKTARLPLPQSEMVTRAFYRGPIRFISSWVPDWANSPHAGKFVVRADVLVLNG